MVFEKEVSDPRVQNFSDGALDTDFYLPPWGGDRGWGTGSEIRGTEEHGYFSQ